MKPMRVYGTSPLYNYVELVFRSRRLFIGSIIVATLVTMFMYFYRVSNYSARTLILLLDTPVTNPDDRAERGTIAFKLNILNLDLRDPSFVKEALRRERLDQGMTGVQFDQFAKQVKDHVSWYVDNNVLEITCTWPDERAANIVNAIFGAYQSAVVEEETRVSTTNTLLMKELLADYTQKRNNVEKTVADYQRNHVLDNLDDNPGSASTQYQQAVNNVRQLTVEKKQATRRFNLLKAQFATVPKTYQESIITGGVLKNPGYTTAATELQQATNELGDLKLKYTENNPKVKVAQQRVDNLTQEVQKFTKTSPGGTAKGPVVSQTESANPTWIMIDNRVKNEEINIMALDEQLAQAQANLTLAREHAVTSPTAQYNYRRMTDNQGLYAAIQANLASQVEQAKMAEIRDVKYKTAEIRQVVKPESEKENKGAKGMVMLAAGPVLGIIIAFCFSLLAEAMDHSLRTPIDVEKHLGKPVLAVLPRIHTNRDSARRQLGGEATRPTLPSS
jgi:uncharacterized protein involved in exopolysaccharide biosynthesis